MPDENTRNRPPSGPVVKISSLARAKLVKSEKEGSKNQLSHEELS